MIEAYGWKAAENLKAGDKILTADGEIKTVDYAETKYYDIDIPIFNLNIDEYHTYFLSDFKLLVHNDCVKPEVNAVEGVSKTNPSEIAQSWQGDFTYMGVDNYKNITLKKGKVIYLTELWIQNK